MSVPATVSILGGDTFVVSDGRGDIDASPTDTHGLFRRDTRFLSKWILTVDGKRLSPLSTDDWTYFSTQFFLVPGTGTVYVDSKLSVVRRRAVVKGHNIMKGYYNRPEATAEVMKDGWSRSGDLGRRDEDGFYYIVDRSKDMIIRGGYNVYPREIEEVLMTHEAVSLAAVIGIPHESHGEEVRALGSRNEGAEITEDELVAWAKEQMASFKYPRVVEFVENSFPMTATGKILKRELS